MRSIINLALKDLRLLVRDKLGLFWVIGFPLIMALFFGSIFGGQGAGARSLKVATVRDSISSIGQRFYDELAKSTALKISSLSRDSARLLVARGTLVAFVEFRGGKDDVFSFFGDEHASIEVGIDPSRSAEGGYLQGLVTQAYFTLMQNDMQNTERMRSALQDQIKGLDTLSAGDANRDLIRRFYGSLDNFLVNLSAVEALPDSSDNNAKSGGMMGNLNIKFTDVALQNIGPRSAFEITFPQSLQWALIGCAAAFALSIVIERTRGTFYRLRTAPISRGQILLGKGLACFIACVIVCAILITLGSLVFKVRVVSVPLLVAAIVASAFCFVGLMMLVTVLGKTEASVSGAGWALFLVFTMIGGGMVPLMMMPKWMTALSNFSPVKWSILATEGAIWRGFGISEMLLPLSILLSIGVAGYLIGVAVLQRSDD